MGKLSPLPFSGWRNQRILLNSQLFRRILDLPTKLQSCRAKIQKGSEASDPSLDQGVKGQKPKVFVNSYTRVAFLILNA